MDVFSQRLRQEYGANVISTSPTVPYFGNSEIPRKLFLECFYDFCNFFFSFTVKLRSDGKIITVNNPSDWPEENLASAEEPVISATIITPKQYMGDVIKLCQVQNWKKKRTRIGSRSGSGAEAEAEVIQMWNLPGQAWF